MIAETRTALIRVFVLSLSRKTDYALLILTALAGRQRQFLSLKVLAETYHLPYRFVAQVVRPLIQRGLLESREGAAGGYRLAKKPADISVREVVAAEEGGIALASCLNPAKHYACPQKTVCTARGGMPAVQRLLLETLARHTVADLLLGERGARASPVSTKRGRP